jgi:hypothetical protein
MTQWLISLVLPRHISQLSVRERHRYELWATMNLCLLGAVVAIFVYLTIVAPNTILVPALHSSVYFFSLCILKIQGNLWLSVSFAQAGNFVLSMYLLITTGGVLSPFLWIMGGIPIVPAVLLDIERNGKIWVGITVIGASCIGVAQYMGVKMAVMVTSSYLTFTIFAATVPLIVYMMIYLVGKERLHREELLLNEKKEEEFRSHLLQAHLVRLQLQNLRSQIQPHFLFNTLNSITALIRWNKQAQAIEAVNNLAFILRFTLQDSLDDMIPLHEEIHVIRHYIALEQIRFGDTISLSLHIPEKLQTVLIPCFCIQLLVENSIKHGFRNLESQGRIIVEAREYLSENLHDNLSENLITISVMDNGIGLPKNWSRNHYGVGLTNLEERLTLLFGKRVTLQLQSNISNGTIASITFPSSA